MKFFCLSILFLLLANTCLPQIRLGPIPKEGILLNKGWRFHAGDNPAWATPDYNDRDWLKVNPDIDVHHLLKQYKDAGIGWFRLRMHFDSSLLDSSFALVISQVVASEIYLNGKLIYKFGNVSSDYDKEKTYSLRNQPFSIHFGRQDIQELAVHYSFSPKRFITLFNTNQSIGLTLKSSNQSFTDFASSTGLQFSLLTGIVAMYLTLGLFCLYFFISFHKEKSYLFMAINSFGQAISLLLYCLLFSVINSLTTASFIFILANTISSICLVFALNAFYLFFNTSKPSYYKVFLIYVALAIPVSFIGYTSARLTIAIFGTLLTLGVLHATIKAVFNQRSGAWIILVGLSISFLCGIANVYSVLSDKLVQAGFYAAMIFTTVPVFMTFFIAGEFARVGLALQKRVIEVKELSDKTIVQEQEKQQILATQNEKLETEVEHRTAQLNKSLQELKSTQAQLIQSEKMASLGELTAGIAHEIQNPLNFVNNFSEVNREMLEELKAERLKPNAERDEALEEDLINDVIDNEAKINHHGKRADAIVKGMLQHSRSSTGVKEPADINALADEYLRLSYHGLRAKDKNFNAEMKTDFDQSISNINIIPQDIGRVLLNLYNNAFYAVNQQKSGNHISYNPTVSVSTKKSGNIVIITVSDNGNGIPQNIVDKIFQPFFTTKPTGQGTGLGLSLSYEIIKSYGGEIKVTSEKGEGSEFVIQLPITA